MANTTIAKAIASGITKPRCSNGGVGGGKLEKEREAFIRSHTMFNQRHMDVDATS